MPRPTPAERQKAKRQARETAKFERKSIEAASRLGFRAMSRTLSAFKRGDRSKIPEIISSEFARTVPVLTELMTVAYLTGLDRMRVARKDSSLAIAAALHTDAVNVLKDRLKIDPAKLRALQEAEQAQAVLVLKRAEDSVQLSLQRTLVNITEEGLTTRDAIPRMRDAFKRNGILPVNSYEFEAVFRTQTQMAYGAASWQAAQDPVVDEILWGYKYVTVGDDRVRPAHIGLDGTTAPKNHDIWNSIWPPNGWGCRCQALYLMEPEEQDLPEPTVDVDGVPVIPGPDKGFDFNPGELLGRGGSIRIPEAVGTTV